MRQYARLVAMLMTAATIFAACSDDEEDTGSLSFDTPALYFSQVGEQQTVSFTANRVSNIYVSSTPDGWSDCVTLDTATQTVTVVAPSESSDEDEELASSGSIILVGTSHTGTTKTATLFVGMTPVQALSGAANCFTVHEKETNYTFAPVRRDGQSLQPASVGVIWQSMSSLVQYVHLNDDGRISFYVGADSDDEEIIKSGNALIGAYDDDGTLLWSWHIWATDYRPEALDFANGYRVMSRNLGALDNANSTAAERLASYGLFYQWGRKEPFIGPSSYRGDSGSSATMYNGSNSSVYVTMEESTSETGTAAYAVQNPLCFITGVEESEYDWRWSDSGAAGWETLYDPCPAGWKVAPEGAFRGLLIAEALPQVSGDEEADAAAAEAFRDRYYDVFGWTLTDGNGVESLYMAAGRRTYADGKFQNVYIARTGSSSLDSRTNPAYEAQPWVGHYWTSDAASGRQSQSLYFWFDKLNASSGIENGVSYARANGMSVRCVKDE